MLRAGSGKAQKVVVRTLAVLVCCLLPPPAIAADWLVLLVDRSNSIDREELRLQREAYIRLLNDERVVAALQNTQVAIVEFDTRAQVVAHWNSAQGAAARYSRLSPDGLRGQTAIGNAVDRALQLLAGKQGRMIIDISGDGRENRDERLLVKARRKATERAVTINGLVMTDEEGPELTDYFHREVATGFVLPVERREDFYEALRAKLFLEIAGTAPPETQKVLR